MRKILMVVLSVLLLAATPLAQAGPTMEPTAGGWSSGNIEWVGNVLISQDGVGGRVVGDYFYANDQNKIMIFDIKDPENPVRTDFYPLPQEWEYSREDLDTNGEILVMPNLGTLYVFDVEDKTNIQLLGTAPGGQHTQSCVLDCTYAYGSDGNIHDLRNPTKPKLLKEKWGSGLPAQSGHDVEEVAPGKVLTATQPIMLLDVKNPTKPKLLAAGGNSDGRFIHSGRWANNGKDNFLLMGGERNTVPRCSDSPERGAFMTWDASNWKKTHSFKMIDDYYAKNGTYTDGNPPANPGIGGCSSHWLEPHPKFNNGGIVAAAFFGHGVRLFKVTSTGKIKEHGYFIPYGSEAGAVYWATDEIMYVLDYNRGIDILRYTGKG
ncbi:MAG: LVIVD repeat-containing protein [Actinomycetota bacterium]